MKRLFADQYRIASTRLKDWDYSSEGCYFVTICTQGMENYFGSCQKGALRHTDLGEFVAHCWQAIPQFHPYSEIDEFIVMPNHLHGVLVFHGCSELGVKKEWKPNEYGPQIKNLPSIIRGFKSAVTKEAEKRGVAFSWQPRYYDHIVRSEDELNRIREYIIFNPVKFGEPEENIDFCRDAIRGVSKSMKRTGM